MELRPNIFAQQRQSTAITAQVIQSIKLLQFGYEELQAYLREQAERNPLIEVVGSAPSLASDPRTTRDGGSLATSPRADRKREAGGAPTVSERPYLGSAAPGRVSARSALGGREADLRSLEEYCASPTSLRDHVRAQLAPSFRNRGDLTIAAEIVESLDPDGYLRRDLDEIADFLGTEEDRVEAVLAVVQRFEPTGVAARDLAECLRLQLRERGLLTSAMRRLLENLKLLAECNIPQLAKVCGVDEEEVIAMVREIRALDPRPGRRYDSDPILPALPDVEVTLRPDGSFGVELNTRLLPRVLVNREYYSEVSVSARGKPEARFVTDCMREANWLTRNLDQRAQTILKVATELVAQQRDFLLHGIEHLRPLCLKDVARATGMHESTVCRAIADKFIMTPRGMFELKFFFASSVGSTEGGEDFSAEAIRHRIRQLIAAESSDSVLPDDALTAHLRKDGVDIARRTVAKYREMLHIPSSLLRRRQKQAERIAA